MPRPLRYSIPGVPQHVVQRGNNRAATFFDDEDRRFYLACLYEASRRHSLAVHAYVLMSNHVHLLVSPQAEESVSRTMQSVGRRYVQFVNLNRRRTGTLWEGRFRASVVQTDRYLAHCHAYIELNPVRARIVSRPDEYPWSSCSHYVGTRTDPLISDCPSFLASAPTLAERVRGHVERLATAVGAAEISRIRSETERCGVFGDEGFKKAMESALTRKVPGPRGRPRKAKSSSTPFS